MADGEFIILKAKNTPRMKACFLIFLLYNYIY